MSRYLRQISVVVWYKLSFQSLPWPELRSELIPKMAGFALL